MPQCAVVGCNNTHRRTKGGSVKYHRFPGDTRTRNQWLKACGKSLSNCSTARICSRHFSEGSYERDVQHELLGLPTRCRLRRGAIPDQNLPNDFLKEERQQVDSAIAVLLAVGLVPTAKLSGNVGGLPEDLNKMQIMEDVREGCDANPPSSPGHAEQENGGSPALIKEVKSEEIGIEENGVEALKGDEIEEVKVKEEDFEEVKKSDEEADKVELEENSNSNHSSSSDSNQNKRKRDQDDSPMKKLRSDLEEHFVQRDKIMNDFVELTDCNNLDQIQTYSDQLLSEIRTLNEMAKEKEREWNQLLHLKKLKEELLIRLQRKRQVMTINESDLNEPETNGQQSLLKCNQKMQLLRELRAANLDKLKQKAFMFQTPYKQKTMLDVQSIIADYRQRHPETVPRRGRRIRPSQSSEDLKTGNLLENSEGLSSLNGTEADLKSYKDILLQFAKMSQSDKELQKNTKPPPPYPEVTVHPVTSTSSVAPTNSLLHGILTKAPVRNNTTPSNTAVNGGKSSFSPTLARLLTAPERGGMGVVTSTPSILGRTLIGPGNAVTLNDIFTGSKMRNEITITPVGGNQFELSSKRGDTMEEELEDPADRLIIDETSDNSNTKSKEDNRSEDGEEVPQCQGCQQKAAQFVCAGCGNQWYCSRDCQVSAWDDHSEVCSG